MESNLKERKPRFQRPKRTELKNRLRRAKVALPPFSGWSVISTECVLSDVAKNCGNGINKRTLKMLVCIYELYKIKGFAYVRELVVLMGMDTKTVHRLLSEMERKHILYRYEGKLRVEGIKPAVSGWTITAYSKNIIEDIQGSWYRLTSDLKAGRSIAHSR